MKDHKDYIAPELTVVSFSSEQGFAVSGGPQGSSFVDLFTLQDEQDYNSQAQQNWREGGNLFDSW